MATAVAEPGTVVEPGSVVERHEPRSVGLREYVKTLDLPDNIRAEIIRGNIVMSPTPVGRHGRTVRRLTRMLDDKLPDGYDAADNLGVNRADADGDFTVPDLFVAPEGVLDSNATEIDPEGVLLVVEVVSRSSVTIDRVEKKEQYAASRIPQYLLIDPYADRLTLFTNPDGSTYQDVRSVVWGEKLPLAEPLEAIVVDSSAFPDAADWPGRQQEAGPTPPDAAG